MAVVRLIHWNESEGRGRASILSKAGYQVGFDLQGAPVMLRNLRENPRDIFAIDLSRFLSSRLGQSLRMGPTSPRHRAESHVSC
jgi:hypothetical protein